MTQYIELLSPAKNIECGIEAVNHGADAVYIGASRYGARADAGNAISDIAKLVRYAHLYGSKVFVTLNTILTDKELEEAERLIYDCYNAGVDALIVQDMGILQLSLPPIALHASTQTDNRTPEKVEFLRRVGFQRVVLARELSLTEIAEIHRTSPVELEAFVHGALCVSYSGQCYMSQAATGRSANRGCCAQYCRLPYSLTDANGTTLVAQKHLLSLKDMNRADFLKEMMEAGVTSFKIEGRLKEVEYVKNITAFYRQRIDALLNGDTSFSRPSWGKSSFTFVPNPQKTFHRGSTDYFLHGTRNDIACFDTPKSVGEYLGTVKSIGQGSLSIDTTQELHNGDGLCFLGADGMMTGCRVNNVAEGKITPAQMPIGLTPGTEMYRNYDHQFLKLLSVPSAERKIGISIHIADIDNAIVLTMTAENGVSITETMSFENQLALKPNQATETLKAQLSKLGGTPFVTREIDLQFSQPWFLPNSQVAELRRRAVTSLTECLSIVHLSPDTPLQSDAAAQYPETSLTYLGNVMNSKAAAFYHAHGVEHILPAFETKNIPNAVLMFCKHCIRHSLGWCKKNPSAQMPELTEPLYLNYKDQQFQLEFDCKNCLMKIRKK